MLVVPWTVQDGVGRRVGEQTEALWSILKALSKIARYMTPAHWWDTYNLAMEHISKRRLELFFPMMVRKVKRNQERLRECRKKAKPDLSTCMHSFHSLCIAEQDIPKDMENLREEAARHGILDLPAAQAVLEATEDEAIGSMSLAARYVEALKAEGTKVAMLHNKAMLCDELPGNVGIHAHEKATEEGLEKHRAKLKEMAFQLGVFDGNHWTADMPEYQAGLKELRRAKTRKFQMQIEAEVFKRQQLKERIERDESKNIDNLRASMIVSSNNIARLMRALSTWATEGMSRRGQAPSSKLLEAVKEGQYPWSSLAPPDIVIEGEAFMCPAEVEEGAVDPEATAEGSQLPNFVAAQRYFGARYRTLVNQQQRTSEEAALLKKEVVRAFAWLEERETCLAARLQLDHSEAASQLLGSAAWGARAEARASFTCLPLPARSGALITGWQALLQRDGSRLEVLEASAKCDKLIECLSLWRLQQAAG